MDECECGDKGFTGAKVLAETVGTYKDRPKLDSTTIDPHCIPVKAVCACARWIAIVEVVDANQQQSTKGLGFKAFICRKR